MTEFQNGLRCSSVDQDLENNLFQKPAVTNEPLIPSTPDSWLLEVHCSALFSLASGVPSETGAGEKYASC